MLIFFYLVSSRHLIQGVKECLYHLLSEWESKTLNFIIDVYIQANRPCTCSQQAPLLECLCSSVFLWVFPGYLG